MYQKMYSETQTIFIDSINKLTKKVIENSDIFHNYYIEQNNRLYSETLPFLLSPPKTRNKNHLNKSEKNLIISNKINYKNPKSLKCLRHQHVRSNNIPRLCPLFDKNGDLIPSIVQNSKIYNRSFNITYERSNSKNKLASFPMKRYKNLSVYDNNIGNSFQNFKSDFFTNDYLKLKYDEQEIFNQPEKYHNLIKNKIEYFKTNKNENPVTYFEKVYSFGPKKKKMHLTLKSLVLTFEDPTENKVPYNNPNINKNLQLEMPFALLPLFYYKGFEGIIKLLCSIIKFENNYEKVSIDENLVYFALNNLKDFLTTEEREKKESNFLKRPLKINIPKSPLKSPLRSPLKSPLKSPLRISPLRFDKDQNEENEYDNLKNYSLRNENEEKKYKSFTFHSNDQNPLNFSKYNSYCFYWTTPLKTFKVTITLPLITFAIPSNTIRIQEFLDFELLFYIYNLNFFCWDFYIIKYLSRFKQYRYILEKLTSHIPIFNLKIFLTEPKTHRYAFTEEKYRFIHTDENNINQIITLKSFNIIVTIIDYENNNENDNFIYFNFNQLIKIIEIGKCESKILFLIKFMDFNPDNTLTFNYQNLEKFDVVSWLNNIQKYNINYYSKKLIHPIDKLIREFDTSPTKKVRIELKKPYVNISKFENCILVENEYTLQEDIINQIPEKQNFLDWTILIKNSINDLNDSSIQIPTPSNIIKRMNNKKSMTKRSMDTEEKNTFNFSKKFKENKIYLLKAHILKGVNKFFEYKEEDYKEENINKKEQKVEISNNNNIFNLMKGKKGINIDKIDIPLPVLNKIKIIIQDDLVLK